MRLQTAVVTFNLDSSFLSRLNSYGHYAEGTGSVLKMADIDVRCTAGRSFLIPYKFFSFLFFPLMSPVPSLGDVIYFPSNLFFWFLYFVLFAFFFCSLFVCLVFFVLFCFVFFCDSLGTVMGGRVCMGLLETQLSVNFRRFLNYQVKFQLIFQPSVNFQISDLSYMYKLKKTSPLLIWKLKFWPVLSYELIAIQTL